MNPLNENRRTAEYIVSEANGSRSREVVTIASGAGVIVGGTVLGIVTGSDEYTPHDPAAVDGSETAAAILYADTDVSGGAVSATITARDSEVDGDALTFADAIAPADRTAAIAALATAGIIVR